MANITETRKVGQIIFREDLYPRINKEPALVQRYADNLEQLPPIEINQDNILVDGWHRWTAHRKNNSEKLEVIVTSTKNDLEIYALAIQRNATHGLQLTEQDKEKTAIKLYHSGNGLTKEEISRTVSVSLRRVNDYLRDVDRQRKEAEDKLIFDMWLSCHTQEEIAEKLGIKDPTDKRLRFSGNLEMFPNYQKLSATFGDEDFSPMNNKPILLHEAVNG